MNKSKGIVDPFTLGLILALGIGSAGVVAGKNNDNEQTMAQGSEIQTELVAPIQEEPKT